jgi:hypothetical protein
MRAVLHWLFLSVFVVFNGMMAWWLFFVVSNTTLLQNNQAAQAGQAVGLIVVIGFLAFLWLAGAVITGLPVLFTRSRKVYVVERP